MKNLVFASFFLAVLTFTATSFAQKTQSPDMVLYKCYRLTETASGFTMDKSTPVITAIQNWAFYLTGDSLPRTEANLKIMTSAGFITSNIFTTGDELKVKLEVTNTIIDVTEIGNQKESRVFGGALKTPAKTFAFQVGCVNDNKLLIP